MGNETNDPLRALDAVRVIVEALRPLDPTARVRALQWAGELLDVSDPLGFASAEARRATPPDVTERVAAAPTFESVADLFAATCPASDIDRALVMGYWHQVIQGDPDFDSFSVNTELKNLGHRVANITQAFNALITKRPALVIQTKKSGSSRQARKRFKLTTAGLQTVAEMIGGGNGADSPQ
jgi:hypothetical protein